MEKLYYNLSEEELTKERKILLWTFTIAFFVGGVYVAMLSPVFGVHHIKPILSLAPFGISFIVGIIALFGTIKRKNIFFLIDDERIEFRYGIFRPKKHSFLWNDISELILPHKERKIRVAFKNGTTFTIDLSWLQRRKSSHIRKHIYHSALYKNMNINKVQHLPKIPTRVK